MKNSLYILLGGFLGAGKSTAAARLARLLTARGLRVGLITNDQASGLVDTANLRSQGFAVEEIAGGCFCCRFDSLLAAAQKLTAATRPDVFIGEPVGSCTDLVATVSYPLRRIYGDAFRIAPLSVLVDPLRALRVMGVESGRPFSPKVLYVYRKQLEEADFIVINKRDLLSADQVRALRDALSREYPRADVFEASARLGEGLDSWFERLLHEEMPSGKALEIDYDLYAEGEALLGWLNCTVDLSSSRELDGNALLEGFASGLERRLSAAGREVAHLKMALSHLGGDGEIAILSVARRGLVPELCQQLAAPIASARMILNLRAEAAPDVLRRAVDEELDACRARHGIEMRLEHVECFQPARPVPTYRVTSSQ